MKLRLFSLILIVTSNTSFTGNTSSVPKQKVTLANAQILNDRAKKTNFSEDFLNTIKFVEIFAEKEMTIDEINSGFTSIYNNMLNEVKTQAQNQMGAAGYYVMLPLITRELNKAFSEVKPTLLEILLKDDCPEIYTRMSNV